MGCTAQLRVASRNELRRCFAGDAGVLGCDYTSRYDVPDEAGRAVPLPDQNLLMLDRCVSRLVRETGEIASKQANRADLLAPKTRVTPLLGRLSASAVNSSPRAGHAATETPLHRLEPCSRPRSWGLLSWPATIDYPPQRIMCHVHKSSCPGRF